MAVKYNGNECMKQNRYHIKAVQCCKTCSFVEPDYDGIFYCTHGDNKWIDAADGDMGECFSKYNSEVHVLGVCDLYAKKEVTKWK